MTEFNFSLEGVEAVSVEGFKDTVVGLFSGLVKQPEFTELQDGKVLNVSYDDSDFDGNIRYVYSQNIPHHAGQMGLNKI